LFTLKNEEPQKIFILYPQPFILIIFAIHLFKLNICFIGYRLFHYLKLTILNQPLIRPPANTQSVFSQITSYFQSNPYYVVEIKKGVSNQQIRSRTLLVHTQVYTSENYHRHLPVMFWIIWSSGSTKDGMPLHCRLWLWNMLPTYGHQLWWRRCRHPKFRWL